jgi:hypothetical protein
VLLVVCIVNYLLLILQQQQQGLAADDSLRLQNVISHVMIMSNVDDDAEKTMTMTATRTGAAATATAMMANRSFMIHPITADESNRLHDAVKARHTQRHAAANTPPPPLLRVAICHPTIFINKTSTNEAKSVFLRRFLNFVSYHRLLGFEHFFFWYEANIAELPLFDTLRALPYVTMTEYIAPKGHLVYGKAYHGQLLVQELCL